jgi:tetratricopeptide (TPR) repeat protein
MRHMHKLISAMICLTALIPVRTAAFGQTGASEDPKTTSLDRSPGWVIILAADYQGPDKVVYKSVQQDAIRAYRSAVEVMGVPPDHIFLLAEGEEINRFTRASFNRSAIPPGALSTLSLLDSMRAQLGDNLLKFRRTFWENGGSGRATPFLAAPTAANYRLARDLVSKLAGSHQFIALIVSSHAEIDRSVRPPRLVVLPRAAKDAQNRRIAANTLVPEDFQLPNTQARYRLLLIDTCYSGKLLQDYVLASGRSGIVERVTDIQEQLAKTAQEAGAEQRDIVPVVMASSTIDQVSEASLTGSGSLFLQSCFEVLEEEKSKQNNNLTLEEWFERAKQRTQEKASSQSAQVQDVQRPVLGASEQEKRMRVASFTQEPPRIEEYRAGKKRLQQFAAALGPRAVQNLGAILYRHCYNLRLTSLESDIARWLLDPNQTKVSDLQALIARMTKTSARLVESLDYKTYMDASIKKPTYELFLGSANRRVPLVRIFTDPGGYPPEERVKMVEERFKKLRDANPLWLIEIKPAVINRQWVVAAPIPGGHIITVDEEFARYYDRSPQEYASELSEKIRHSLATYEIGTNGRGGESPSDLLRHGMVAYSEAMAKRKAGEEEDAIELLKQAMKHYEAALEKSPRYAEVYLQLAGVQEELQLPEEARKTLARMDERCGDLITREQRKRAEEIRKRLL